MVYRMKVKQFRSLYTHATFSALPEDAQQSVHALKVALSHGEMDGEPEAYRGAMASVSAAAVPHASYQIREIARLHPVRFPENLHSTDQARIGSLLRQHPALGWLIVFHGDGYLRQAALEHLPAAPMSPFEFCSIVYRLNDWVDNVRRSAEQYAAAQFPVTPAAVVAQSAFFLLSQANVLGRWTPCGRSLLEQAIYRPDVLLHLKDEMLRVRSGRVSHILRLLLRRPDFDRHLPTLALEAALPPVRAVAMEMLLMSRARWFIGYREEWIDKVYGISRRVPVIGSRATSVPADVAVYLNAAVRDRSALVRKVAAEALATGWQDGTEAMDEAANILKQDRNPAVQSRAVFYLQKRSQAASNPREP
ncbi:MAG: hypothetical protein ACI8RZ_005277 [Myxococcota bacterium]|jgi:hypothetical protein